MAYKQHFIEWFSGKQLPSYWTQTNVTGSGASFEMKDDSSQGGGGFKITPTSSSNIGEIDFNNKRQFSQTSSMFIATARRNANPAMFSMGLTGNITNADTNRILVQNDSAGSKFKLGSYDGSSGGALTSTTIGVDGNWRNHKLELTSSSVTLTVNNVLHATRDENLPASTLQPYFLSKGGENGIRYMECYNT